MISLKKQNNTVCFILPSNDISGGIYVVLEHATRIDRRNNYNVFIVMKEKVKKDDLFWFSDATEITWLTFEEAEMFEFDAVISTLWSTCYDAHRLRAKRYIYFNQSVESKFYRDTHTNSKKLAESTYLLGMNVITEASWIRQYLLKSYGICTDLVLNGIRKDIFNVNGKVIASKEEGKLRVIVEGPLRVFFKNTEKAIEICLKSRADEVWLMTNSDIVNYKGVDQVFSRVPFNRTADIYRSCDLIVKLSYVEGMFGPPLEMFHCGGTAIVYNVSGHDEYIIDNYNAYVVDTGDEGKVVHLINKLKNDRIELNRLKQGAIDTASKWWDWESASIAFEEVLDRLLREEEPCLNQYHLKQKTLLITEGYANSANLKFTLMQMINIIFNFLLHKKSVRKIITAIKNMRTTYKKWLRIIIKRANLSKKV